MKFRILFLAVLFIGVTPKAFSQSSSGPERGSLVVVGGGRLDPSILEKFIELAGGKDANIVVVPTALGLKKYNSQNSGESLFKSVGVRNITVLHTTDRQEANSKKFTKPLENADGIWFGGGRQWRLVDSYKGTRTEELFWEVLNRGGVIGGSSAGATIQGSYLARGDTKNNQIMMGDHEEGFGFIKNIAIDQHVLARNRQFDMFSILRNKPDLLGIGIDENTAIVVQGDEFEVIGNSYVLIYDNSFWSREGSSLKNLPSKDSQFYFLRKGDRYNLKKRKIIN